MLSIRSANAFNFAFIATKADKLSRMQVKKNVSDIAKKFAVPDSYVIATSSETRQGKEEVLQRLEKVIAVLNSDEFNVEDTEDEDY